MNTLKTALLMTTLTVLFVLVGSWIGGQGGMMMAFAIAVLMNVGTFWFSDKMALRMAGARQVSETEAPRLHAMVREVAKFGGDITSLVHPVVAAALKRKFAKG